MGQINTNRTNRMSEQMRNLSMLVSDLLDVTRINAGRLELNRESFSLDKLIDEFTKSQAVGAKSKKEEPVEEVEPAEEATGQSEEGAEKIKGISVQRYKGLGEMNANELWETTMDPANRILKQVRVEDAVEADHLFDVLMGNEVLPRKKFIQSQAALVKELDI